MEIEEIDFAISDARELAWWVTACIRLRDEVRRLEVERHADETARAAAAHRAEEGDSELAGEVELLRERVRKLAATDADVTFYKSQYELLVSHNRQAIATISDVMPGNEGIVPDIVRALADAYRSEKDRADRLQAQLDADDPSAFKRTCSRAEWERLASDTLDAISKLCEDHGIPELADDGDEWGPLLMVRRLSAKSERLQAQLDTEQDRANLATALAGELQAQLDAQPQVEAVGWGMTYVDVGSSNWWLGVEHCPGNMRRRVYLGPAEPIESEVKP